MARIIDEKKSIVKYRFNKIVIIYSNGRQTKLRRGVDVADSTALSREPFFSYAVKKTLVAI